VEIARGKPFVSGDLTRKNPYTQEQIITANKKFNGPNTLRVICETPMVSKAQLNMENRFEVFLCVIPGKPGGSIINRKINILLAFISKI
jgi:hypothetical protein